MSGLPDREQRRDAVLADGHVFVWASAGTGKTHTLTLRALYLLLTAPFLERAKETGYVQMYTADDRAQRMRSARGVIRRYVLTTFTRKAAAEMQERLFGYFELIASAESFEKLCATVAGLNQGHGDDQLIEVVNVVLGHLNSRYDWLRRGAEALAELATELQVCTLHSLAVTMLRRHPIAAGIPPTAQFAEEDEGAQPDVKSLLVSKWWERVAADPELGAAFAEVSKVSNVLQMSEWLEAVYDDRWIVEEMEMVSFDRDDERVEAFLAGARKLVNHAKAGTLKDVKALGEALGERGFTWERLCRTVDASQKKLFLDREPTKKLAEATAELTTKERAAFESAGTMYPLLVARWLRAERAETWEKWRAFLRAFADWADKAAVTELGVVTFDDMIRLAAELLTRDAGVRREERGRLWGILVDEFQDTDPWQLTLLECLVRRERTDEHEVTGFFVGDGKQSIYRFRDADLPAIERFHGRYGQIVKSACVSEYRLTASFRSLRPVIEFVNDFFQGAMPLPGYADERLQHVRAETGEKPVWLMLDRKEQHGEAGARRMWLARETARLIGEHRDKGGACRDVVVLVRTHTELEALLTELEASGIPVVSSGARTFYQQPETLDVLNVLIAAHDPLDTLAVGALLRSPMFGLTDDRVAQLLSAVPASRLFHGEDVVPDFVGDRVGKMRALCRSLRTMPVAQWLRNVREFVPTSHYAASDTQGRALVRIENVLASFHGVVSAGRVAPLEWLLTQRARAKDTHDDDAGADVSVTDESMEAVRVMTIHKAKGLQGKFVIVYGWHSVLHGTNGSRANRSSALSLTSEDGNLVRGFALNWGEVTVMTRDYTSAVTRNAELDAAELSRLAYVAATRARDRLVLLSPTVETEYRAKVSSDKVNTVVVGVDESAVESERVETYGVQPFGHDDLWMVRRKRCEADLMEPLLHKPSKPEHAGEGDAGEESDFAREARDVAMEAGTLLHAYLERHVSDVAFDEKKFVEVSADVGVDGKASDRARDALSAFLGGELHRRVREAKVLAREMPVLLTCDDKAWSGVMDLVVEEGGVVRGIDYKLKKKPARLPEDYARQQDLYTEALRRVFAGRTVAFEFWWLG
jgi:ATP-dependent exoDNAse (exonuclease V) beta subunit